MPVRDSDLSAHTTEHLSSAQAMQRTTDNPNDLALQHQQQQQHHGHSCEIQSLAFHVNPEHKSHSPHLIRKYTKRCRCELQMRDSDPCAGCVDETINLSTLQSLLADQHAITPMKRSIRPERACESSHQADEGEILEKRQSPDRLDSVADRESEIIPDGKKRRNVSLTETVDDEGEISCLLEQIAVTHIQRTSHMPYIY
eukprot:TRINITY_DN9413_c0_g1_i2.p1 TRINITY_DN9413_c0_g1~~TRINITY_DN9413_c0_g1_i2.p1  ORF type:complete len:199 (+),score=43.44 TRINITY_DN9413_c0_g1_i2:309-905(+)